MYLAPAWALLAGMTEDERVRALVDALTDEQRAKVAAVFADDLARGWIPKWWDVEAVVEAVRSTTHSDR